MVSSMRPTIPGVQEQRAPAWTLAQVQQSSSMTAATATNGLPADVVVAQASWNPQQKPIASWIAPIRDWASQHGWSGAVTSGCH
jgi:hypothetical protein